MFNKVPDILNTVSIIIRVGTNIWHYNDLEFGIMNRRIVLHILFKSKKILDHVYDKPLNLYVVERAKLACSRESQAEYFP